MKDEWKYDPILNGEKSDTLLYYYELTKEQLDMLPPIPNNFIVLGFDGDAKVADDVFWCPEEGIWKETYCD